MKKLKPFALFALVFLQGCSQFSTGADTSLGSGREQLAEAFAPDDPRAIRARAGGTDIGLTQRSTAADGTVVFHAEAPLLPEDQNVHEDIYLKTPDGELTRITRAYTGAETNNASLYPCISDDGNFVAYCSRSNNLVPGDTNDDWDVFVFNRTTGATSLVSVDNSGVQGERGSLLPSLSADGTRVTFVSRATLTPEKTSTSRQDVFVRDLSAGTTTLVSHDEAGGSGNSHSYDPVLSGDGSCVAYASRSTNLVPGDNNGRQDIFCYDTTTGFTTRITDGNSHSYWPSLSTDGSLVGFTSYASNLVAGDTNARRDIFTWDGANFSAITHGNGHSGRCVVNGGGTRIAFDSEAEDLASDGNGQNDIFLANLSDVAGTLERTTDGVPSGDQASMSWDGTYLSFNTSSGQVLSAFKPLCPYPGYFGGFDGARKDYDTQIVPTSFAVGDIDKDGDNDVVFVNGQGYSLLNIMLNDGTGKLEKTAYSVPGVADLVEMGDLNGDGFPDLVCTRVGTLTAYLNQGDSSFTAGASFTVTGGISDMVLGDVDNDGDLDCAYVTTGNNVAVALNDGNGVLATTSTLGTGQDPRCVELGDINEDGIKDVVISTRYYTAVVYHSDGLGGLSFGSLFHSAGTSSDRVFSSLKVVDVDGDGDNDILGPVTGASSELAVIFNSSGTLGPITYTPFGHISGPGIFDAADVDGDGDIDAVALNSAASTATLYLNQGGGTYTQSKTVAVGGYPNVLRLADLTGDGLPDFLTGNQMDNLSGLSVLTNSAGDFPTPLSVLSYGKPASVSVLDVDGDGNLDIATALNNGFKLRRGDGAGGYDTVEGLPLTGGSPGASSEDWGDLNGDGVPDYVASLTKVYFGFVIGLSDGSGNWTATHYDYASTWNNMRFVDVNGDGVLDCVGKYAGQFGVALNNGDGTLAARQYYPLSGNYLEFADLDGDGDIDVCSTRSILLNNGDGTFGTEIVYASATPYIECVALGDIDGDGDIDIARAHIDGAKFYLNDGNANCTYFGSATTNGYPSDIELVDIDGDGDLDTVQASATTNSVVTMLNDGSGVFSGATYFGVGNSPVHLDILDYDQDGDLDVVTANQESSDVTVLLNQTCSCGCE